MHLIRRRSLAVTLGSVATAALTLLLMAPRPMFRPPPRPRPPQQRPILRPRLPARSSPRPITRAPAVRNPSATFSSSVNRPTLFGPANFHATTTLTGNSRDFSFMKSTPFGSANFHLNSTLSGSINTALTLTRMINASATVNGHTANFSATNSFTLTATQIAAAIVAQRIRHRERAVLRRDVIASAYSGYGFPASAYPSMMSYSAAGYGGGGYSSGGGGYPSGGGMAYGSGGAAAEQQGAAPGVQVAGNEENRPTPDEQAVNRLLAAAGVSDPEGNLLWPVGLRALPADRDGRLRGRIDALLAQEKNEAASGTVTADLQRDLTSAVDTLRKQLLRDREERFSLTHRAYEDAEDYLAKLKQVSKQLVKAGEAATRELRGAKPGTNAAPEAAQGEVKQVGLFDDRFDPPQLTVPVGTTIRWTNHGQHKHTVTSDKRDWGSKELGPAAVYSYTFTRPGTYAYHCEKHPGQMRGTVVVK